MLAISASQEQEWLYRWSSHPVLGMWLALVALACASTVVGILNPETLALAGSLGIRGDDGDGIWRRRAAAPGEGVRRLRVPFQARRLRSVEGAASAVAAVLGLTGGNRYTS